MICYFEHATEQKCIIVLQQTISLMWVKRELSICKVINNVLMIDDDTIYLLKEFTKIAIKINANCA